MNAVAVGQEALAENPARKAAAEEGRRQKKGTIIERWRPHGGPCKTVGDIDELLKVYAKTSDQLLALKAEVQYRKVDFWGEITAAQNDTEAASACG